MVKRFVCCHKDIPEDFLESAADDIVLVSNRDVQNASKHPLIKTDGTLDDRMWSELSCFKTMLENSEDDDFICVNHYRRILECPKEPMSCVAQPLRQNLMNQLSYSYCHCFNDLDLLYRIVKEDVPMMANDFRDMLCQDWIFPYNMLCLPRNVFANYLDILTHCLQKVLDTYHIQNYEDITRHIEKNYYLYLKDFAPNNTIEYQARIVSFLAERLTTVYMMNLMRKTRIQICPVRLLEPEQKI